MFTLFTEEELENLISCEDILTYTKVEEVIKYGIIGVQITRQEVDVYKWVDFIINVMM